MEFSKDINGASARFTRVDNGKSVDVIYNPAAVEASSAMMPLMKKLSLGDATAQDVKEFGKLWQERVKRIFENLEKVVQVKKT